MKYIKLLILFFLIIFNSSSLSASNSLINELKDGKKIIFIRHSYAPGNGDPNNFSINDCSTQRNLNKKGIQQSKDIGNFDFTISTYASDKRNHVFPSWSRGNHTQDGASILSRDGKT